MKQLTRGARILLLRGGQSGPACRAGAITDRCDRDTAALFAELLIIAECLGREI